MQKGASLADVLCCLIMLIYISANVRKVLARLDAIEKQIKKLTDRYAP